MQNWAGGGGGGGDTERALWYFPKWAIMLLKSHSLETRKKSEL